MRRERAALGSLDSDPSNSFVEASRDESKPFHNSEALRYTRHQSAPKLSRARKQALVKRIRSDLKAARQKTNVKHGASQAIHQSSHAKHRSSRNAHQKSFVKQHLSEHQSSQVVDEKSHVKHLHSEHQISQVVHKKTSVKHQSSHFMHSDEQVNDESKQNRRKLSPSKFSENDSNNDSQPATPSKEGQTFEDILRDMPHKVSKIISKMKAPTRPEILHDGPQPRSRFVSKEEPPTLQNPHLEVPQASRFISKTAPTLQNARHEVPEEQNLIPPATEGPRPEGVDDEDDENGDKDDKAPVQPAKQVEANKDKEDENDEKYHKDNEGGFDDTASEGKQKVSDDDDKDDKGAAQSFSCDASICPMGKVLKPPEQRPQNCTGLHGCSAEECCLGTCDGFSCPASTTLMFQTALARAAAMCSDYTCTEQQCCSGLCSELTCPGDSTKKDVQDLPDKCNALVCGHSECCTGACSDITCPAGSAKMASPLKCDTFPCKTESCCGGTCEESLCSVHGKALIPSAWSTQCEGVSCKAEECCAGSCGDITCPAGSAKMASPLKCDTFPCKTESCCSGLCEESLCSVHGKALIPSASSTQCEGVSCKAEECCAGSCGDGVDICTASQPPLTSSSMPSACSGWNCTLGDCCVGTCSPEMCLASGLQVRENPQACSGKDCMPGECCVGSCSEDVCPQSSHLMLKADAPSSCHGITCTEEECCSGTCHDGMCAAESGFRPKTSAESQLRSDLLQSSPQLCQSHKCTSQECCVAACASSHCQHSAGKTMKLPSDLPTICKEGECTSEECCDDLGTCTYATQAFAADVGSQVRAGVCNPGRVPNSTAPRYCETTVCTDAECCTTPSHCDSSTCSSRGYVLKLESDMPLACEADRCHEDECCTRRRMVYWIEKTSGTIRRCRYDQCDHNGVKIVKSGLSLPEGIAFDTKRQMLYWTNTDVDKVQRCDPDNCHDTTEDMVTNAGEPLRLSIDVEAGFLYWSERASFKVRRCPVGVAPCASPQIVVQNDIDSGAPYGIAVDPVENKLYWTGSSKVQRCDLSGLVSGQPCHPEHVVGPLASLASIIGVALDVKSRKIFWSLKNKIEECPMGAGLTEADIKTVTNNVDMVRGLVIDGVSDTLYMAEGISSGRMSRVRSCNVHDAVGSCAATTILMSGCPGTGCLNMPYDVALDWSVTSVLPEARQLPAWATQSWSTLTANLTGLAANLNEARNLG